MKNTLKTVLVFAVVLVVLLLLAVVIERAAGARVDTAAVEPAEETASYNEYNEAGAAVITLLGDTASVQGLGAQVAGNVVTIMYPGTYRVEGTLEGQLTVDLGDYSGAVYILMNGADITCPDGPALYVIQADRTTVRLAEGTRNSLTDGEDYLLEISGEDHTGAALYSSDDLVIEGTGALEVTGNASDGIRAKDKLTITEGSLNITSIDDGIQANDELAVSGGSILIGSGGDGISVSHGGLVITDGYLWINSSGDALVAVTELSITGGTLNVTACGGSELYPYIALNDISAKGIKADSVTITGGTIDLDTADDCISATSDVTITGGSFTLSSGDDAIHADGQLEIRNVAVDITACYEGLEAGGIHVGNIWIRAFAENNGVDAGADGFVMDYGILILNAPRAIGSEGILSIDGGTVTLTTDGTDSPLSFTDASVTGGMSLYCVSGSSETVLETGEIPGSLLFVLPSDVPGGTTVTLWSAAGEALYETTTTAYGGLLLYAGEPLAAGQSYTLTAGDYTYTATVTDGCTVTPQTSQTAQQGAASGEMQQSAASGEMQQSTASGEASGWASMMPGAQTQNG